MNGYVVVGKEDTNLILLIICEYKWTQSLWSLLSSFIALSTIVGLSMATQLSPLFWKCILFSGCSLCHSWIKLFISLWINKPVSQSYLFQTKVQEWMSPLLILAIGWVSYFLLLPTSTCRGERELWGQETKAFGFHPVWRKQILFLHCPKVMNGLCFFPWKIASVWTKGECTESQARFPFLKKNSVLCNIQQSNEFDYLLIQ